MRRYGWIGLVLLAGCGGTTTNDGFSPYNRGAGQDGIPGPSITGQNPTEVVATHAYLNITGIKDPKVIANICEALKKQKDAPKRVFLLGASSATAKDWKKGMDAIKVPVVPVFGTDVADWSKTLKAYGSDKLFSNGPTISGPNPESLTADQKNFSSTAIFDSIRYYFVNADTPTTAKKEGTVPRLWFLAKQKDSKEANGVVLSNRLLQIQGKDDRSQLVTSENLWEKKTNVRLWAGISASAVSLERPKDTLAYQMGVSDLIGEDKMPFVGLVQLRKNGSLTSKVVKLSLTAPSTPLFDLVVYDPTPIQAATGAAGPSKEPIKSGPVKPN
ncbi:MAG TPA: hypothetical protein VK171_11425 [Fimbriimonas sp.]|nr:hypothetical protein [Fimbriimonas sp.]